MSYTKFHDVEQMQTAGVILRGLLERFRPQCHILFFLFTYEPGSVSFVATFPERSKSIEIIKARLERWAKNAPPEVCDPSVHGWLPQAEHLNEWNAYLLRAIERQAPGCGYAMFCGQGRFTQYQSSGDRENMKVMLQDIIDNVKAEMA